MNTTRVPGSAADRGRRRTASTRELGLDLAQIAARYLFQTDHLHYGYWPEGLAVEPGNLRRAQENYADLLVAHIPPGARTILDVGTGTGALARRLLDAGYAVDCVSPSPHLTERARAVIGEGDTCLFECRYEDLHTERCYDLILFSESFQYVEMEKALAVSADRLRPGGHLLICDFFRNDTPERGPFGGGHPLAEFRRRVAAYPLCLVTDRDITEQTSPNLDLTADFVEQVVAPARDRVLHWLTDSRPLLARALRAAFRRHLERAEAKYLSGQRSGANFRVYKSYRLLVFRRCGEGTDGPAHAG